MTFDHGFGGMLLIPLVARRQGRLHLFSLRSGGLARRASVQTVPGNRRSMSPCFTRIGPRRSERQKGRVSRLTGQIRDNASFLEARPVSLAKPVALLRFQRQIDLGEQVLGGRVLRSVEVDLEGRCVAGLSSAGGQPGGVEPVIGLG